MSELYWIMFVALLLAVYGTSTSNAINWLHQFTILKCSPLFPSSPASATFADFFDSHSDGYEVTLSIWF